MPISSTKTKVLTSSVWAAITLQDAHHHSSSSTAPTLRFWEKPSRFISRLTVTSLRCVPVMCPRERRLWLMVAVGCSCTSFASRTVAFPSTLRGRPGLYLGVRISPRRAVLV